MSEQIDKIICIGKNYLDHAKELGDKIPEKPVIFLKPPSVLKKAKTWGETVNVFLPKENEIHYECEIVLKIKNLLPKNITLDNSMDIIEAVTIGLDMTKRDLQTTLKKNGHPWTTAKVFPDAAIIGPWVSVKDFPDFMQTPFSFYLNNTLRQTAYPHQMLFSPAELITYISEYFPLCENDIIFTGTPAGVGSVKIGDQAELQFGDYQFSVNWK